MSRNKQEAELINKEIASQPQAIWLTGSDVLSAKAALEEASQKGELAVLVLYNIPGRDNGQYSAGGEHSPKGYAKFIKSVSDLIGSKNVLVVVEPDALMLMQDLPQTDQQIRCQMLQHAVQSLKQNQNARIYLDAGHSHWHSAEETAKRLTLVGIEQADGFALNISNYRSTEESIKFGENVSRHIGGKHFLIDTSRNGNGAWDSQANDSWCNPPGRALGKMPTFDTGNMLIDAFLWIKHPGESDGECRGGPQAGQFWPQKALELISNRKKQ
jgi:endoglucanase